MCCRQSRSFPIVWKNARKNQWCKLIQVTHGCVDHLWLPEEINQSINFAIQHDRWIARIWSFLAAHGQITSLNWLMVETNSNCQGYSHNIDKTWKIKLGFCIAGHYQWQSNQLMKKWIDFVKIKFHSNENHCMHIEI